ncbi:MAG: metal ABC transporter permease [Spirochaetota bacterium]
MIDILLPAFIISLVLLGIHSYFGLRIIERNIIFTDLAIGQMAAFGAAISLLLFDGGYIYIVSLSSAIVAGMMIYYLSKKTSYLEAVIGLIYALGFSGVYLLLSKSAHGAEEFQRLVAYDILFTNMSDVLITAILYACIAVIIKIFTKKISEKYYDLFFFLAFAVTVTSSVKMAGVLVVFAILLGPAFIAKRIHPVTAIPELLRKNPLIIAWIVGTIINLLAIIISYKLDLPTGYSIVFLNALVAVLFSFMKKKKEKV